MKDITSLCKRVICVHNGSISYDGKLDLLLKKLSPVKEILIVCRSENEAIQIKNSGFTVLNKTKMKSQLELKTTLLLLH